MKIDLFTKGILTVIAVALGLSACDAQPSKYEIISAGKSDRFWLKDGNKVKQCRYFSNGTRTKWFKECGLWVLLDGK